MWEQVENELESSSNVLPLISSPGSSDWQIWEPVMLYFDCSSLPSTPTEELTLWTHSFTHQSEKFDAKAQDLDRLSDEDFRKAVEDFIRRKEEFIRKREELLEQLKVFDVRFEEKVYTAGTSQVSLSMLSMETKSENPVCGKPVQVVDESPKVQCTQFDAKFPPKESVRDSFQQ